MSCKHIKNQLIREDSEISFQIFLQILEMNYTKCVSIRQPIIHTTETKVLKGTKSIIEYCRNIRTIKYPYNYILVFKNGSVYLSRAVLYELISVLHKYAMFQYTSLMSVIRGSLNIQTQIYINRLVRLV